MSYLAVTESDTLNKAKGRPFYAKWVFYKQLVEGRLEFKLTDILSLI